MKLLNKKTNKDTKNIKAEKNKIAEEKQKIKESKLKIKEIKRENFKKSKFYKSTKKVLKFIISDKDKYTFSEVLVVTILSIILGAFACFSAISILCGTTNFIKLSNETKKFTEAYEVLVNNYYENIDKEELIEGAIAGMMNSTGDIYTIYSNNEVTEEFNELVNGKYEGIGATIQQTETGIIIIDMYNNSPAEKSGLEIGDVILKVDDIDALKTEVLELSEYIKNKKSKDVTMKISRDGEEKEIKLTREVVEVPAVVSKIYEENNKKIGYIDISIFSSVASKQFEKQLIELEKENIDGLVIDVRDNNGGYLTTVVDIINKLLPKNKPIYQIQKQKEKTIYKDKTKEKREYPIAVLVNGNSASASEILAAAIKESYDGHIVGTQTYGKGTVQQIKTLSDGSMIKYTIENWLSPNGNWIDGVGVIPTNVIEQSERYYKESTKENDVQLNKALELVSK